MDFLIEMMQDIMPHVCLKQVILQIRFINQHFLNGVIMFLAIFVHKVDKNLFLFERFYLFIFNFYLGISQLTLDEEPEDDESISDQTSTTHSRNGDSLLIRQNPVTTHSQQQTIIDQTRRNLATLRQQMYSIIQRNIDPEEYAHELLEMNFRREQEVCF
jgi:hypothetical protein